MDTILVTGNENKLREFKEILGNMNLKNKKIDLDEIQSMKLEEICDHKVKQAYELLKKPVIVEDTGLYLDELGGLPGPFIKFFNDIIGIGSLIKLLGNSHNRVAKARTCIAYYDGKHLIRSIGEIKGTITKDVQDGNGFGFDFSFQPDGYNETFSQMSSEQKNKISHRALAIKQFQEDIANYLK